MRKASFSSKVPSLRLGFDHFRRHPYRGAIVRKALRDNRPRPHDRPTADANTGNNARAHPPKKTFSECDVPPEMAPGRDMRVISYPAVVIHGTRGIQNGVIPDDRIDVDGRGGKDHRPFPHLDPYPQDSGRGLRNTVIHLPAEGGTTTHPVIPDPHDDIGSC